MTGRDFSIIPVQRVGLRAAWDTCKAHGAVRAFASKDNLALIVHVPESALDGFRQLKDDAARFKRVDELQEGLIRIGSPDFT